MTGTQPEPWQEQARCRGNHRLFFPAGEGTRATHQKAITICKSCPVRRQCLALAMRAEGGASTESRYGVFGGRTPAQRRALYRRHLERRKARRAS